MQKETLKQTFFDYLLGKTGIKELEEYVYTHPEIESVLGEQAYLELIEFNYNQPGVAYEITKLIFKHFPEESYIQVRIKESLKVIANSDSPADLIYDESNNLYDDYCNGAYFLEDIALGYALSLMDCACEFGKDSWDELNILQKQLLIARFNPGLADEAKKILNLLESSIVTICGYEPDEVGPIQFSDSR